MGIMYEIKGRTAFITGAAKRIGRSVALSLANSGMNIVVHYNTSKQAALEVQGELKKTGVMAWLIQADLAIRPETETLIAKATEVAGTIDVLVNNASIFRPNRISEFSLDELDLNIQINALSPLILSRAFGGQTKGGAVINLLDTRVAGNDKKHAAYLLSKKMLLEMTRMLALELAPDIRVNAVAPGLILPPPGEDQSYLERMKHNLPLNAYGKLENVTEAVRFLVTNDFVTGQVIFVDGGRHLSSGAHG
jgi:hypothetical protein